MSTRSESVSVSKSARLQERIKVRRCQSVALLCTAFEAQRRRQRPPLGRREAWEGPARSPKTHPRLPGYGVHGGGLGRLFGVESRVQSGKTSERHPALGCIQEAKSARCARLGASQAVGVAGTSSLLWRGSGSGERPASAPWRGVRRRHCGCLIRSLLSLRAHPSLPAPSPAHAGHKPAGHIRKSSRLLHTARHAVHRCVRTPLSPRAARSGCLHRRALSRACGCLDPAEPHPPLSVAWQL